MELDLRKEDKLLLCCARTRLEHETENEIRNLVNQGIEWDYLIKLANRHNLKPLIFWHVNKLCPEDIPENIMVDLKDHFDLVVKKNLLMLSEFLKIINLFKSNNLCIIPYKGLVLAILAYGNIALREFFDLDFYVDQRDILDARDILIEEGYYQNVQLKKNQEKAYLKFQREFLMVKDVHVEIKWKYISPLFTVNKDENFLSSLDTKKLVEIFNTEIKTLSNEELVVLLSVHNVSHYWSRLSLLCDIFEVILSDESIRWSQLLQIAEKNGFKRILLVNLVLTQQLWNLDLPEIITAEIENDKCALNISGQIKRTMFKKNYKLKLMDQMIIRIKLRENYGDKIKDLVNMLFLPTPDVITSVTLPISLFSFYYVLRFFQLFMNIIKKNN